ncbi:MAG TPA: SRPBCC family protein [Acidimicrobiia bacterium]|nr:SRPBCC family protein [Acidimicrobiia bacterium]
MPKAHYEVTAHSKAKPDAVYALLADATAWPKWAGPIIRTGEWERTGDPPPGGVGAIRKVGAWPIYGREQIVVADRPNHHHAYTMLSGNPVRNYRADVHIEPDGDGSVITWQADFDPLIPGTGGMLAAVYKRLMGNLAKRVGAYAEREN